MSKLLLGHKASWPEFHAVNDTLRGGSSSSSFSVDTAINVATFSGVLDITTLGGAGFASQSTIFPNRLSLPRSRTAGLLVTFLPPPPPSFKADGESPGPVTRFLIALKTNEPARRPDGRRESVTVYEWVFDVRDLQAQDADFGASVEGDSKGALDEKASSHSVTCLAKWDDFKPTYRGRPQEDAEPLDPSKIYELSFMARSYFGEQAGEFTLDIVSVSSAAVSKERPREEGWLGRLWQAVTELCTKCTVWVRAWWSADRKGALRLP